MDAPAETTESTGPAGPAAETAAATTRLAAWTSGLSWHDVPEDARDRLLLAAYDTLGVAAAGARLPENRRLLDACGPPPGPAPIVGAGRRTTPDTAAWLGGIAACSLELDEGNKYARGHPAAHGFPAVLAMASTLGVSGPELCSALLAAYETASRFGRATVLRAGAHPHGSWGVAGAAAGVARLLGLDAAATAVALDTAAGLPVAAHFDSALDGNPVRNAWIGASNTSGIAAARIAASGTGRVTGTAARTLGDLLGGFDPGTLTAGLGTRYDVALNYYKRHASCSYTHPPADALVELVRAHPEITPAAVTAIDVETHSLAAGLARTRWPSRLAAMFSLPYAVAAILRYGALGPDATDQGAREDGELARIAGLVRVRVAADLDQRLPGERAARVTVTLDDGRRLASTVPNPVGDADHHPLGHAEIETKLSGLLGADDPLLGHIRDVTRALPDHPDAAALLDRLGEE